MRRAAIVAAAAEAFARSSYASVTISDIARRAGASDALLYRYFAGKEPLYAEVVRLAVDDLLARQAVALGAVPDGAPVRDRVRAATVVYLDHIAGHPQSWARPVRGPGSEPEAAADVRARARGDYVDRLRALLATDRQQRHEYALWGYFGFLDAACLRWVDRGCPDDERWAVVDAALGALEGALGDWGG